MVGTGKWGDHEMSLEEKLNTHWVNVQNKMAEEREKYFGVPPAAAPSMTMAELLGKLGETWGASSQLLAEGIAIIAGDAQAVGLKTTTVEEVERDANGNVTKRTTTVTSEHVAPGGGN